MGTRASTPGIVARLQSGASHVHGGAIQPAFTRLDSPERETAASTARRSTRRLPKAQDAVKRLRLTAVAALRPAEAPRRGRGHTTDMGTLNALIELVGRTLSEWRSSGIGDLVFNARNAALLAAALLAVIAATVLVWRSLRGRLPGRTAIALPAVLPRSVARRRSPFAFVRHAPFLLFLAGLPFFCLALADPHSSLSARQVSYPGRRIAVIMDASLSMLSPFSGQQLKTQSDTAFSNTMAAAEYFIRVRMKGRYRDLIALEQFGNEAYVITPFTTDYENLLLSLKMISDVNEWQRFPDQGTIIMKAIDEGVDLFNAFDFLDSSGNIMVIFSDGQDNNVQIGNMIARSGAEEGGRQQGAGLHDPHGLRARPLRRRSRSGLEEGDRRDRRQVLPGREPGNHHAGHQGD